MPEPDAATATVGGTLFEAHCRVCHDPAIGGAPTMESMRQMPRDQVFASLQTGTMRPQTAGMSDAERSKIVDYVMGEQSPSRAAADRTDWACAGERPSSGAVLWSRWGGDLENRRHVDNTRHNLRRANVQNLELQWAFGFPDAVRARSQPVVTEHMIYTGSQDGTVYALDRETGCVWWSYQAAAEVRSSITVAADGSGAAQSLYFGDFDANVYAVDANTGAELWKRNVADHTDATLTGSITHYDGRLFVPMSSTEILSAYQKEYACCTFRGGVLALQAQDGATLWRMYTTEEPSKQALNPVGVQQWGPSGAPVWSAPTVDAKRGLVYVGTGENYSSPANDMSDAIIAMSLETGEVQWVQQTLAGDAWNGACVVAGANCPAEDGPDFDFGAPPILATVDGKDYLLAGQKSGMIYGLDPDDEGKILWERRMGMGGFNGGVHWGMTVSGDRLLVPITDTPGNRFTTGEPQPGMHALDIRTGEPAWSTLHPAHCKGKRSCYFNGLSAAPTATDELVIAASLTGLLSVYDLETGERVWTYETHRPFDTVNGVEAAGGTIDSAGAVLSGDQLFVNSGYDKWGEVAGNVLLVFGLTESSSTEPE